MNFSGILNQNTKRFIHGNASEIIVCEKASILSRGDEFGPTIRGTKYYSKHSRTKQTIVELHYPRRQLSIPHILHVVSSNYEVYGGYKMGHPNIRSGSKA